MSDVIQLWPTNLFYQHIAPETTDGFLKELIELGNEYDVKHNNWHVPPQMRKEPETSYNLLQDESPVAKKFKVMLKDRMEQFAKAEGFLPEDGIEFEGVCNIRTFKTNEYARSHNHRSVDYVAVYFLSVGVTDTGANVYQSMAGNRLFLVDPVSMRSRYLNHRMLHTISPVEGTFVIHPASIFHNTELNLSNKDLIALVTNIRVVDKVRNYEKI